MKDISVGEWVCVSEDGLHPSPYNDSWSWESKRSLLADVSAAHLDAARRPKVQRLAPGRYLYTVKNCDTLRYAQSYEVVQLTHENIQYYRELIESALKADEGYED